MRDRLIELIQQADAICGSRKQCEGCAGFGKGADCVDHHLADHLLASGVIVPPVELGSKHRVYIPVKGTTVVYETKVYGIGIDEDGDMVINPKEYPEEVISINGYNIGKTVFLTKEEAEKALERSGK